MKLVEGIDAKERFPYTCSHGGFLTRYDEENTYKTAIVIARGSYQRDVLKGRVTYHVGGGYGASMHNLCLRLKELGFDVATCVLDGYVVLLIGDKRNVSMLKTLALRFT